MQRWLRSHVTNFVQSFKSRLLSRCLHVLIDSDVSGALNPQAARNKKADAPIKLDCYGPARFVETPCHN
jgi:hypothetical protein